MRRLIRFAVAVAFLLLLATPVLAQGRVIINNPDRLALNEATVRQAAEPLVNRGAAVAIYIVRSGGQADFLARLVADGLARPDGTRLSNVIGIYVALTPKSYSSIIYGDQWSDALTVNDNYEVIRSGDLNPGLPEGKYTQSFVTALGAINKAIENPPVPGGGTTNNISTLPIVIGIGVLIVIGVASSIFISRRRAGQTRAEAQQRLKDAREGAGSLIATLGQRFQDAAEKAKYDKVSYIAADVNRLQSLQREATERFTQLQGLFDDTGEQLERSAEPTNEQLAQATAGYEQVKLAAQEADVALKEVEALRVSLDEQARLAREELERAKKA
ncbi:MAG: hypothetical protein WCP31_09120 [Chloroflexales bacterium]